MSRLNKVFTSNNALAAEEEEEQKQKPKAPRSPRPLKLPVEKLAPAPSGEKRQPGRPPGKRSNPQYLSVTTFQRKDIYLAAQKALIGSKRDYGDVVDELVKAWLKRNGVNIDE